MKKGDGGRLITDKAPGRPALNGSNPTTHLASVYRLPYTLQVNLKPLCARSPLFVLLRWLTLLLPLKQKQLDRDRSAGCRGG